MDYKNTETKLDTLASYFNDERINLVPIFQRRTVWTLPMRKELIKNIVKRRPIPAIFLYKGDAGSKYSYNILDGKQRLETILMFIGSAHHDFQIKTWSNYLQPVHRKEVGFPVDLGDGNAALSFAKFDPKVVRELREYPIPTIEIELNENTSLDEMVNLFVDINQYGMRVTRLDIVKALKRADPLLREVFGMIAERQKRHQTIFERRKRTPFASVLKNLQVVKSIPDPNAQADRMWERLTELVLFVRSGGKHRKPSEILKTFIKTTDEKMPKLTKPERATITRAFDFLRKAYSSTKLKESPLATDQTHFYILATSLLDSDLLDSIPADELTKRLVRLSDFIDGKEPLPKTGSLKTNIKAYLALSSEKTTDVSRRSDRQKKMIQIIRQLGQEVGNGPTNGVSKIRRSGEETSSGSTPGIAGEGEGVSAPKEKDEEAG